MLLLCPGFVCNNVSHVPVVQFLAPSITGRSIGATMVDPLGGTPLVPCVSSVTTMTHGSHSVLHLLFYVMVL